MRVGIVAFLHESNTFLAGRTDLEAFAANLLADGEAVRTALADAPHEVGGFFAGLAAEGLEAVPVFAARALPSGVVTAAAFAELRRRLDAALDRAGPLDGLLAAPHGATVAESAPDADGAWLAHLRRRLGPKPLVATLDLHANLSPAMVAACDALIAYRTNPHLDQRDRGIEAARLLARTLRGEVRPTMAAAFPPLAVNIEKQATAEPPCRPLYDLAEELRHHPGVLAVSLLLGFPYADVAEMGAAVVAVTDGDPVLARAVAAELAGAWWQRRAEFTGDLLAPEAAVARAAALDGPVGLLDMGDNVGGGSPGDGTVLAHLLHAHGPAPALVCLHDPAGVAAATAAGIGTRLPLAVGGHADHHHGAPLEAVWTVRRLWDGRFEEPEARHGGYRHFDQGPTAVVATDGGLWAMLTTRRMAPFSLRQLTASGLDPRAFRVLVLKGVHAPVAAYAPVCRHLLRVNTPGVTTADLSRLPYQNRRRPMYPFEPATAWEAGKAEEAVASGAASARR